MNKELYRAALSKKFSNYCQLILKNDNSVADNKEIRKELFTFVKSEKWHILFNPECRIKNKVAAFSLIFGIRGLKAINHIKERLED